MRILQQPWSIATSIFIALATSGPVYSAEPARDGEVTLYRDKMGVPHIYGRNAAEAFFGAGYALGQDRLAQSELALRRAQGRLAEIMGPASLASDKEARVRSLSDEEVSAMIGAMRPDHRTMVEAVVAGLNLAIDEANADPQNKLPYEFGQWGVRPRHWTLADYVEAIGANWRGFGSAGGNELINLKFYQDLVARHGEAKAKIIFNDVLPLDDPDAVPVLSPKDFTFAWPEQGDPVDRIAASTFPPVSPTVLAQIDELRDGFHSGSATVGVKEGASRAFVVSGKRSASGKAMLLEATSENPDVHFVGGDFEAVGFTTPPGTPPLMGRSPHHAWLSTTGESDVVDIFSERLNPANRYQYWYQGKWRDMTRSTETIVVKGASSETVEIVHTIHGPVIAWDVDNGVAYSERNALAGFEMANWGARVELARAKTLEEFERAVRQVPTNTNILYAGADGRIGFWHAGRIPIRAEGVDPRLPTPGTGEYEWRGLVPADKLPHAIDPEAGFLHAWNNKPAAGLTYGDTSRYGKTFRTWMGQSLGEANSSISMDDMRRFNQLMGNSAGAYDLSVTSPKFFTPYLSAVLGPDADPRLRQAVKLMSEWNAAFEDNDGDGRYDHPGLTLFRAWVPIAQNLIIGHSIGDWWHRIDDDKFVKYRTDVLLRAIEGDKAGLPMRYDWFAGRDRDAILRKTLTQTIAELEKRFGSTSLDSWKMPIYWKYYDASKQAANPQKPAFGGRASDTMAGELGLIPAMIPNNLSESWNVLMELGTGPGQIIESSTPLGGQSQFINLSGKAGPHVGDQINMHEKFQFKVVNLDRDIVERQAELKTNIKIPARIIRMSRE